MKEQTYTDWFHVAKVYSATAGCIIFWAIRHIQKKDSNGNTIWRLANVKLALVFPAFILAINIIEAVTRDFQVGKGAWLQHGAQTLAIWCMFAQTFPSFLDSGAYVVKSTYQPWIYNSVAFFALASNIGVFCYMIYQWMKTKRNPYTSEICTDLSEYKSIKALSE